MGIQARNLKPASATLPRATRPLTEKEIITLLSVVDIATVVDKRDMVIMYCMLYAGLTVTDIEKANVEDIQHTLLDVRLRVGGKGRKGKPESVHLDRPVLHRIRVYLRSVPRQGDQVPLFLSHSHRSKGMRLDARSIRRRITSYLAAADLQRRGVTAQSLSLTAVALWLNDGMSMDEVRQRTRDRRLNAKVEDLRCSGVVHAIRTDARRRPGPATDWMSVPDHRFLGRSPRLQPCADGYVM